MKSKDKVIFKVCILTILILIVVVGVYPCIYEYQCKNRIYDDMQAGLPSVFDSNIKIISVTEHDDSKAYSAGASGVIFRQSDERYYAFTAYHVVADKQKYLVSTTKTMSLQEYRAQHGDEGVSHLENYYNQLPEAKIEYVCEDSDIAIISFVCDEVLPVISVSECVPVKGNRLVMVATMEGQAFQTTYGKIISKEAFFEVADGQAGNHILRHSAYEAPGSSGAAVMNEKMELIGLNIGGGVDAFGRFKYGVMIPCDQVWQCIKAWQSDVDENINDTETKEVGWYNLSVIRSVY